MKRIYYKEAKDDKLVKGDRATISTDGIKTTVTEYVDFVKSGLAMVGRYDVSFMGFADACKTYESRGYKEIKG